ncbi:MAG: NAD(P)/FAD-dependent oxidoreductase [Nitrospirota bacterium]|nr:NAD(P)/FAD-dependent oxidoreductase [Nitrospirota bacterium]
MPTHSPTPFDAAVVGAGPAGCMAARHLAAAGLKVALIERQPLPRYKTCGGGLVGRAVRLLPESALRAVESDCHRAALHLAGSDLAFTAERAHPIVRMTMRANLDAALAGWAVAAGATLMDATPVTGVVPGPGGVTLHTASGALTAPVVIAADGAGGLLSRTVRTAPARMGPAVEWEIHVPDADLGRFQDIARFDVGIVPHGYGWVFPKGDHLSVGVFTGRAGRMNLHRATTDYLNRIGLTRITHAERHGHRIPVHPGKGPFAAHGILLTGDAAGFAEPVTGEGISAALESGHLAARSILAAQGDPTGAMRRYVADIEGTILPELAAARRLAWLLYAWPPFTRQVFAYGGQRLCERVADVMAGTLTWRQLFRHPSGFRLPPGAAKPTVSKE